jgi:hypothetical protein
MGNAYTALASGTDATYWNPAGLAIEPGTEAAFSHFAWYQDITLEHGSVTVPAHDRLTVGASFTYLNYGDIDAYTATNEPDGQIDAHDWALTFSAGYAATEAISLGISAKYVTQRLDDISANGVAFDIGTLLRFDRFNIGLAAVNLGPGLKYERVSEDLPAATRLGVAVLPFDDSFVASAEFDYRRGGSNVLRTGFEWNHQQLYFVRTGYERFVQGGRQSIGDGLSFGLGMNWRQATIDYAYSVADQYSAEDVHRFSFTVRF